MAQDNANGGTASDSLAWIALRNAAAACGSGTRSIDPQSLRALPAARKWTHEIAKVVVEGLTVGSRSVPAQLAARWDSFGGAVTGLIVELGKLWGDPVAARRVQYQLEQMLLDADDLAAPRRLALTLAIHSIPMALGAKDAEGNAIPAAIAILQGALGAKVGNALAALASMAMWFCGLSCVTSASRGVYALARDGGLPFSRFFSRVSAKYGTPGPAIWTVVLATILAMAWSGAVPVVTSLSTAALYLAYIVPVVLGFLARKRAPSWTADAVWNLGSWGRWINIVAIVYAVIISIMLMMPPNQLAGKTLAGVVAVLVLLYWGGVRRHFKGPEWAYGASVLPGAPK